MKLLITADCFLPSTRGTGPVRSLVNFVNKFATDHELFIVTRDRDLGASKPYEQIVHGQWNDVLGAKVRYISDTDGIAQSIQQCARMVNPDAIYMNSVFSPLTRSVLLNAWRGSIPDCDLLLAVRGELNPGALAFKRVRKYTFLMLGRAIGLFRRVRFQASTPTEQDVTRDWFSKNDIIVAMDIPDPISKPARNRHSGRCRFVFNSRVSPIKNLEIVLNAIESLANRPAGFPGTLEIHGAPSDPEYGETIKARVRRCGDHASYCGPYHHDQIWQILDQANFTVLPSRGENFAHAIYESATAGVPFLISDKTPWTDAANGGAGWVNSPDDQQGWERALMEAVELSESQYLEMSHKSVEAAEHMRDLAHRQHEALFGETG